MMRDELIEKIHDFFGADSMYFGVDAAALADHLLANGVIVVDTAAVSVDNRPLISQCLGRPLDEIIELVQAKEDGRIIVPPCKVGDEFYGLQENSFYVYSCYGFKWGKKRGSDEDVLFVLTVYDMEFIWGEEAFATEKEAERALAERQENDG